MRLLIVASLFAISYAQTEFSVTIYVASLDVADSNQQSISSAVQTAFTLSSITLTSFTEQSSLDEKVLVVVRFQAPESEIQNNIQPLSPSERIARSSDEMDALGITVTDVSVTNTNSATTNVDKEWWEEALDWVEKYWLELSIVAGSLVVYACVLMIVCSQCCGRNKQPPPPTDPPPTQNPYKNTVPRTTPKPIPSQTTPSNMPSPNQLEQDRCDAYVQIFEEKLQPALKQELEMQEFREKEKNFFGDDGEDIVGEIMVGDRCEIWSKHIQSWIKAEVIALSGDDAAPMNKVTVTYQIQGVSYRKKVRVNDSSAIRFRNSEWE